MKDKELKRLLSANVSSIASVIVTIVIPYLFVENFSIYGTHLTWLCICSAAVGAVTIILHIILKPNPSNRRSSLAHKVARFLRCCVYFCMSCIFYHGIIVLYGAPLMDSVLETFLFAVLLSTFTVLHCLCLLGPNIQVWLRVFSKNGATSIWDNSLQITTLCTVVGAWFGAFPIPLDWDRPWQVWPISCSLGATFGYVAGLLLAPLWIYWNRKQLTYKSR